MHIGTPGYIMDSSECAKYKYVDPTVIPHKVRKKLNKVQLVSSTKYFRDRIVLALKVYMEKVGSKT